MRHSVVLVPFPFDDLTGQKVRPAVCLTDPVGVHRHVVLAFITSVLPGAPEPSDVLLTPATTGFAGTRFAHRLRRAVAPHGHGFGDDHPPAARRAAGERPNRGCPAAADAFCPLSLMRTPNPFTATAPSPRYRPPPPLLPAASAKLRQTSV